MKFKELSRARERALITLSCAVFFAYFLPIVIPSRSRFRPLAIIPVIPPVIWGFCALFTYRRRAERIVGWVTFLFGIACFGILLEGNLIYGIANYLRC